MNMRILVATLALLALAPPALAAPPEGDHTIEITQPEIWVPAESDPEDGCGVANGITLCMEELERFVNGQILFPFTSGNGQVVMRTEPDLSGDLVSNDPGIPAFSRFAGVMGGPLRGTPDARKLKMAASFVGNLRYAGLIVAASAKGKVLCDGGASPSAALECAGTLKLCATESRRKIGCTTTAVDFPLAVDGGPWELLFFELATDAKGRVTGGAFVRLDHGPLQEYVVAGKYDAASDRANLSLKGLFLANKSRIKITDIQFGEGAEATGVMRFRVAAHTGTVDPLPAPVFVPPPPPPAEPTP